MIQPDNNEDVNNLRDFQDTDNDRPQDGNADAAESNTEAYEQSALDDNSTADSNTDEVRFNGDEQEQAIEQKEGDESQNINAPLTTQGDSAEREENMGGTTNLTLDQLKKEHDPEGTPGR